MAHVLSLLRWQLYACKTQHAFVLSQGRTANSALFGINRLRNKLSYLVPCGWERFNKL